MDPITLGIFAIGAALVTNKPRWEEDLESSLRTSIPHVERQSTDTPNWSARQFESKTSKLIYNPAPAKIIDPRELLKAQIKSYATLPDDWNGDGASAPSTASLMAASKFLASIPAGIQLPKPMLSTSGAIEFYWDFSSGYADISFDEEGVGSFFSKLRTGEESFQDDLDGGEFTYIWFQEAFSGLRSPIATASNEKLSLAA